MGTVLGLFPRSARAASDPYDWAFARAAEAARQGDFPGAARALATVVPAYPQDYAVALALGDLELRAADYSAAERAFRIAVLRAPSARAAHLGLGWALVREGRCDQATPELRALTYGAEPGAESARRGVETCTPLHSAWGLDAAWNEFVFPAHPFKASASGFYARTDVAIADRWVLAGAYRFAGFNTVAGSGVSPFAQNEGYAHAGYDAPRGGITADAAVVVDGSGYYGTSWHVGASARFSPFGDLLLRGSVSVYPDETIGRVAPAWKVHVAGPLSLLPGAALQFAGGQVLPNASLSVLADWSALSLWAGGKYGDEARPAYLEHDVVYDIPERVAFGAWAGVRVRIAEGLWGQASYSFDRLHRTDPLHPSESDLHAIALGPSLRF
ncbi:MAG TPA: tetratricopeptide repeat protein [Polyangiaceae bacterium]|jgi:hypothetical protein